MNAPSRHRTGSPNSPSVQCFKPGRWKTPPHPTIIQGECGEKGIVFPPRIGWRQLYVRSIQTKQGYISEDPAQNRGSRDIRE